MSPIHCSLRAEKVKNTHKLVTGGNWVPSSNSTDVFSSPLSEIGSAPDFFDTPVELVLFYNIYIYVCLHTA